MTLTPRMHVFGLWEKAGEHTSSTQKGPKPGIEPMTFWLWSGSANHCTALCHPHTLLLTSQIENHEAEVMFSFVISYFLWVFAGFKFICCSVLIFCWCASRLAEGTLVIMKTHKTFVGGWNPNKTCLQSDGQPKLRFLFNFVNKKGMFSQRTLTTITKTGLIPSQRCAATEVIVSNHRRWNLFCPQPGRHPPGQ